VLATLLERCLCVVQEPAPRFFAAKMANSDGRNRNRLSLPRPGFIFSRRPAFLTPLEKARSAHAVLAGSDHKRGKIVLRTDCLEGCRLTRR